MIRYRHPFEQWLWESGVAYVLLAVFAALLATCWAVIAYSWYLNWKSRR
jgi:hypothetical protein